MRACTPPQETLSVDVKPGWKKGTRVTFQKKGACGAAPGLPAPCAPCVPCMQPQAAQPVCAISSGWDLLHRACVPEELLSPGPPSMTSMSAGDERPGTVPADIVFVIEEKPHPVFTREGNDLVYTAKLPLVDALCGATVRLTSLDGRQLTVRGVSCVASMAACQQAPPRQPLSVGPSGAHRRCAAGRAAHG